MLLATLIACSTDPPFVHKITPEQAMAGDRIILHGEHLSTEYTYSLGAKALSEVTVSDPTTATATVPDGVSAGDAELIISTGQADLRISGLLSIAEPPPADPCDPSVQRMTHIPSTADVVKIDLYRGEEVERIQFSTGEIDRIEYESHIDSSGQYCASIWLQTQRGRVLFDADRSGPLREQAQKIANGLGKPIDIGQEATVPEPG